VGNTQLVKKKVTYLSLNVETAHSNVIKVLQCRHFTKLTNILNYIYKVDVKHLISLENNVNM